MDERHRSWRMCRVNERDRVVGEREEGRGEFVKIQGRKSEGDG